MNLSDCGSPGLDTRSGNIQKPTSLKTSDRASMLRFFGFPLDIFGEVFIRLTSDQGQIFVSAMDG